MGISRQWRAPNGRTSGRQRAADLGRSAAAVRLDQQLAVHLAEIKGDLGVVRRRARRATRRASSAAITAALSGARSPQIVGDPLGAGRPRRRADRSARAPTGAAPVHPAHGPAIGTCCTILQRNAAEQPPRAAAVGVDLGAKRIHIGKRALVAQPLHERQADGLPVEIASPRRRCGFRSTARSTSPNVGRSADIGNGRVDHAVDRHASWRRRRSAGPARCRSARLAVGNPSSRPRPAPRATVPSMK